MGEILRFDRDGRLERLRERREAAGYAGPGSKTPEVDHEAAKGKERLPWTDVEGWLREQANPRLRGLPTKDQQYHLADDLVRLGRWWTEAVEQISAQLKESGKGQRRGGGDGSGVRGNAEFTSVEAAALAPPDPDEQLIPVLEAMVKAVHLLVAGQRRVGASLARRAEDRPFYDAGPPRGDCPSLEEGLECTCRPDTPGGHCPCCGVWASGARGDRIVSGLCERSCRSAWRRWLEGHPADDRVGFVRARRAWLAERAAEAAAVVHEDEMADRRARKARDQGRRAA